MAAINIVKIQRNRPVPVADWRDGLAFGLTLTAVFAIGVVLLEQDLERQERISQETRIVRAIAP